MLNFVDERKLALHCGRGLAVGSGRESYEVFESELVEEEASLVRSAPICGALGRLHAKDQSICSRYEVNGRVSQEQPVSVALSGTLKANVLQRGRDACGKRYLGNRIADSGVAGPAVECFCVLWPW